MRSEVLRSFVREITEVVLNDQMATQSRVRLSFNRVPGQPVVSLRDELAQE